MFIDLNQCRSRKNFTEECITKFKYLPPKCVPQSFSLMIRIEKVDIKTIQRMVVNAKELKE